MMMMMMINCDVTDYVVMFLTVIFQIQNM